MSNLQDQYRSIIERIIQEYKSERARLVHSLIWLCNESENLNENTDESDHLYRDHEGNLFALLCLKVSLRIQIAFADGRCSWEDINDDLDSIIECAEKICFENEASEYLLKDVRDVLQLICLEHNDVIGSYFSSRYNLNDAISFRVSRGLFYLATQIARAFERLGYLEQSLSLLEGLCDFSKQRGKIEIHRELVVRVLALIGENNPESIIRIARNNNEFFDNVKSDTAGDFFWFKGSAFNKRNEFQEAIGAFEKCYEIRLAVFGEDDWFTAIAKRELSLTRFNLTKGKIGREELVRFIWNIEERMYAGVDPALLVITKGKTLFSVLFDQSEIKNLQEYEQLLELYEELCEKYDDTEEPTIKRRLSRNLRGGLCFLTGDYIQAERYLVDASLCDIPDTVPEIVTIPQIKNNLLLVYYIQNDMDMAVPLLIELLELLDLDSEQTGLTEKDEYRIYALMVSIVSQSMTILDDDDLEEIKILLGESCTSMLESSPENYPDNIREICAFILCAIPMVLLNIGADREEQQFYLDTLSWINRNINVYRLDPLQRVVLNYIAAILSWNNEDSIAETYFANSMRLAKSAILPLNTRISLLQSYATFSARMGKSDRALTLAEDSLSFIESLWQSYIKYLNDERLMQILVPAQLQFIACYAVLRSLLNVESAYNKVLKFKELASLAERERNRVLHGASINKELLRNIRDKQDKLAAMESESLFRDNTNTYNDEKEELRKLEAEFARSFPSTHDFENISFDNIKKVIPDESVIIEYFYCALEYGVIQFKGDRKDPEMGFDIYITQKTNGNCRLNRITVSNGEQILDATEKFLFILQAESNGSASLSQLSGVEALRAFLFENLVNPILPYMQNKKNIYIAPDQNLINLPFDLLYDEDQGMIEELAKAIKVECARDFLFHAQSHVFPQGNLIIGNPLYEVNDMIPGDIVDNDSKLHRLFTANKICISQLPFSQMEAEQIGRRMGCRCYTGSAAIKRLLIDSKGKYKNIHVATHGYFDTTNKYDKGQYTSCLLFSGAANWLADGKVSALFGNGIITADEISRLDLRGTELVVLSSCMSGMNELSFNKGFLGMIGAFSAAGVHYVVSHLWEADDFSTAILMDAFYYYYIDNKQSPPDALVSAKRYLRQISILDLKRRNWLGYAQKRISNPDILRNLKLYGNMDDEIKPFKDEAFWGGFVCYQCY